MIINRFWFTRLAKGQIKKVMPPLKNMGQATHTLQLGNDRLILKRLRKNAFYVLDIENLRGTWEEV